AAGASAATATVDFTRETGALRPALHSSGIAPRSYPRAIQDDDAAVKSMGFAYARTHDWALVNSGQRVVDYQYLFPLFDKDPKDPSNYYFAATDHLLGLARNVGLKLFYRLGTSIEHTGNVHFNAAVPKDFDKVAEIFAATVRHYNKGWANGKNWNVEYWEIWNEPDGITNMWCDPEDAREWGKDPEADAKYNAARVQRLQDAFVKFFVICLKRVKSEFPDVKVGGPALCWMNPGYFRKLLQACKDAGVAPDFISWHYYGADPSVPMNAAKDARKLCDEFGFTKCELILNEWHYILTWDGIHGRNSTPAMVKRAIDGPTGHNQIDSAAFTLTMLTRLQTSLYDQAYFYGCAPQGNWGYMDQYKQFNKNYYACKLFGDLIRENGAICAATSAKDTVSVLAAKSKDGKKRTLLLTDYRGTDQVLTVDVKGCEKATFVSAVVLDHARDAFPCDVSWRNGRLTLVKPDKNSAAYLVTFEF
ncbi:MAG: hypothetical protein MJ138_08095, partial [Kiritimatiellae bacterium]|nr:hypothetical protein [Kiritimatiellia bacterium]